MRVKVTSLPPGDGSSTLIALYAAERQTGFTVQTALLAIWAASATYLTATAAVLTLSFGEAATSLFTPLRQTGVLLFLPFPAVALAGYHAITFGIGIVHSRSIQILEDELFESLPERVKKERKRIGSKQKLAGRISARVSSQ